MKRSIITVIIGIAVVFVTLGCNLIDTITSAVTSKLTEELGNIQVTAEPEVVVVPYGGEELPTQTVDYLLYDDFSDPQSGWEIYEGEYGTAGYRDGGYLVEAVEESQYMWGVAGKTFSDIQIDVDATVLETVEAGNDAYGVDCRVQANGDGYGFRISSDGWVAINKYVDMESVALVEWIESDAIFMNGVNHLTAICDGNQLTFLVNGQEVAQVTDDTYTSGDIALSAVGLAAGKISVLFDNVLVQNP